MLPRVSTTTDIWKVLGIGHNRKVAVVNCPVDYQELIGETSPKFKNWALKVGDLSLAHLFVSRLDELRNLIPVSKQKLNEGGAVWVSWQKNPLTASDVNEHTVQHVAEQHGLTCKDLCELHPDWWGVKLVPQAEA